MTILENRNPDSLFIGGSHNGKTITIDLEVTEVRMPKAIQQQSADMRHCSSYDVRVSIETELYKAHRFHAVGPASNMTEEVSQHFRLFALDGLSAIDVMRSLIANYHD